MNNMSHDNKIIIDKNQEKALLELEEQEKYRLRAKEDTGLEFIGDKASEFFHGIKKEAYNIKHSLKKNEKEEELERAKWTDETPIITPPTQTPTFNDFQQPTTTINVENGERTVSPPIQSATAFQQPTTQPTYQASPSTTNQSNWQNQDPNTADITQPPTSLTGFQQPISSTNEPSSLTPTPQTASTGLWSPSDSTPTTQTSSTSVWSPTNEPSSLTPTTQTGSTGLWSPTDSTPTTGLQQDWTPSALSPSTAQTTYGEPTLPKSGVMDDIIKKDKHGEINQNNFAEQQV